MSIQTLNIAPQDKYKQPLFKASVSKVQPVEDFDFQTSGISFLPPLNTDVFEKSEATVTPIKTTLSNYGSGDTHSGESLKQLFSDLNFLDRKVAAHYFVKKASPIEFKQPILDDYRLEPRLKAQLVDIAENLELMSKAEKVEFMRDMTGTTSNFARYAEKVLIHDANPGIKETLKLFKPNVKETSIGGLKDAFSAMGVGLLMMPLVLSGKVLFNPNLIGRFVAGLGIALA